jgi:hypothetical protein
MRQSDSVISKITVNQIGTSLGAVSGGAADAIVATTDTMLGTIDFPIIDAVVRDSTGSPKREI